MQKFNKLTGKVANIPISNIDTDMIIPKQYLKTIKRSGLGKFLFAEQRYDMDGKITDFILNTQPDSKIIIAGENFGCGSSREHAPWALLDFGIRAVVAPGFADIFYNNCFKNGILPLIIPQHEIDELLSQNSETTIDLEEQSVQAGNMKFFFQIDEHRKKVLLEGLDDIENALKQKSEITAFEQQHFAKQPWLQKEQSHA